MIKLGTSDMAKAYVCSSEVSKMYLGSELVYTKEVLPYDAKVEYLQTDKYAYINTEIYPTSLNLDIQYRSYGEYLYFGWIYNNKPYNTWIACTSGIIFWKNWKNYKRTLTAFGNDWSECRYKMDAGFWKNDTKIASFNASLGNTAINNIPLYLFTVYDSNINDITSNNADDYSGKIKWCKIYTGDTLVRDFIPVRVGNVGYMYDKVSKQLFGNAGTGSFILGPDV